MADIMRLLVTLLAPHGDLARGAERARAAGLGALFFAGLAPDAPLPAGERRALRRAAHQAAADDARVARETDRVLSILSAREIVAAPLKGRLLALDAWPSPELRPPGDLDLLVPEGELERAAAALVEDGYRRAPAPPAGRFRPPPTGIELLPPAGRRVGVDLHARLFRSVGRRLSAEAVLARARPGRLGEHAIRVLDPADRLLFVFVHAAKHGVRRLKWLLDLAALTARADEGLLREAARRAVATGTGRALFAALRLAARLPGVSLPPGLVDELRPPRAVERTLDRLFSLDATVREAPLRLVERYALELTLEPGAGARAKMALGVLERLVRAG